MLNGSSGQVKQRLKSNTPGRGAIMQLVAVSAPDAILHGNPGHTHLFTDFTNQNKHDSRANPNCKTLSYSFVNKDISDWAAGHYPHSNMSNIEAYHSDRNGTDNPDKDFWSENPYEIKTVSRPNNEKQIPTDLEQYLQKRHFNNDIEFQKLTDDYIQIHTPKISEDLVINEKYIAKQKFSD